MTTNEAVAALDVEQLQSMLDDDEQLVGVQALREQVDNEPCTLGCLAPGSSAHYHTRIVGWRVIGTRSTVLTDVDMMPYRSSVIWRLNSTGERPCDIQTN